MIYVTLFAHFFPPKRFYFLYKGTDYRMGRSKNAQNILNHGHVAISNMILSVYKIYESYTVQGVRITHFFAKFREKIAKYG